MVGKEEWKAVKGYEGFYEVSNMGRVRSLPRQIKNYRFNGKVLKQFTTNGEYLRVTLSVYGKPKIVSVHRLVAEAFVPNPQNKETVNHINEIKQDNRAENLEWLTLLENVRYGTRAERARKTLTESIGVAVYQLELDGHTVLKKYKSLTLAAESVGVEPNRIWGVAYYGGMCKNYRWIREDKITPNDLLFWFDNGERVFGTFRGEKEQLVGKSITHR